MIQTAFWNPQQGRLRTFWRVGIFLVLYAVAAGVWGVGFWAVGWADAFLTPFLTNTLGLATALVIAARVGDRRPLADYGFHLGRTWWRQAALGVGLGVALMGGIFAVTWAAGWARVEAFAVADRATWAALGRWAVAFALVAWYEETFVRGYLLRNLAEGLNVGPLGPTSGLLSAWVISSALFGLLHLGNPHATWVSTANLVLAGLLLGLGYLLTGELALPIGLHFAWNFMEGPVLGFPVSGLQTTPTPLVRATYTGPDLWLGGTFGPEAGLLGLLTTFLGMICLVIWAQRRGQTLALHLAVYPFGPGSPDDGGQAGDAERPKGPLSSL